MISRALCATLLLFSSTLLYSQNETSELPTPIPDIPLSNTIPVCYITTENGAPIISKEDYINAEIWIDPVGLPNIEAIGSKESPVVSEIRGRGNSSWVGYGKKPYRIKFSSKKSPFGFPKSKHFALLAHAPTQTYFSSETAFELARLIDLDWVPRSYPVEVVLNGVNIGVYAFSETVRIDTGRIEIDEQPEENTDITTIPYGWLIEIDNTDDFPQIRVPQTINNDSNANISRFTIKTPEVISTEQEEWITNQLTTLTHQILNPDKSAASWTDMLDIESLAKYYIIQEVTGNFDAFVGSTYLYKGDSDKWTFGPLWDSEWTFARSEQRTDHFWNERVMLTGVSHVNFTWIKELVKFPEFRTEVSRIWKEFYPEKFNQVYTFIDNFYNLTKEAYETNDKIWPDYISLGIHGAYNNIKKCLPNYADWFNKMVTDPQYTSINNIESDLSDKPIEWFTLQGIRLSEQPTISGIYIYKQGNNVGKVIIKP